MQGQNDHGNEQQFDNEEDELKIPNFEESKFNTMMNGFSIYFFKPTIIPSNIPSIWSQSPAVFETQNGE